METCIPLGKALGRSGPHLPPHTLAGNKTNAKNAFFSLLFFLFVVKKKNQSTAFVRNGEMKLSISHDIEDDKLQWQKRTTLTHTLTLAIWTTLGNSVRHDIGITS